MKHLLCSLVLVSVFGAVDYDASKLVSQNSISSKGSEHVRKVASFKDWRVVGETITAENAFVVEQSSPIELAGDWRVVGGSRGA